MCFILFVSPARRNLIDNHRRRVLDYVITVKDPASWSIRNRCDCAVKSVNPWLESFNLPVRQMIQTSFDDVRWVTVQDVVNNTGGRNNGTETAIYSKDPDTGAKVTTTWTFAEYQAGLADGSITNQGVADTRNTVNRGNILVGAYDGGGNMVAACRLAMCLQWPSW